MCSRCLRFAVSSSGKRLMRTFPDSSMNFVASRDKRDCGSPRSSKITSTPNRFSKPSKQPSRILIRRCVRTRINWNAKFVAIMDGPLEKQRNEDLRQIGIRVVTLTHKPIVNEFRANRVRVDSDFNATSFKAKAEVVAAIRKESPGAGLGGNLLACPAN